MEQFTPQQRFVLYLCALQDYEESLNRGISFLFDKDTYAGLCTYYKNATETFLYYGYFKYELPELFTQRSEVSSGYWFPIGEIEPRITCLKNAIQLLIDKYGEELWNG